MGNYLFYNIHVYSVVTSRGFSFTVVPDSQQFLFISGVKEHGYLRIRTRIVINACFFYWWFDVFGEIWSNIDTEFVETICNVLLIFISVKYVTNYGFHFRSHTFLLMFVL